MFIGHGFRNSHIVRTGPYGIDRRCTGKLRPHNGRQADGANAHDHYRLTGAYSGFGNRRETGLHHIHTHKRIFQAQSFWNFCQIPIGMREIKGFLKSAVYRLSYAVCTEVMTGMGRIFFYIRLIPVRRNRGNRNDVSLPKIPDITTGFQYFRNAFVPQRQIRFFRASLPDGVNITRARRDQDRFQQCTMRRLQCRPRLLHISDLCMGFQNKCFHFSLLFCFFKNVLRLIFYVFRFRTVSISNSFNTWFAKYLVF